MDVHHHSKPGKKEFKEYFLDFLMIFLAVTLGFFAEQMREHLLSLENNIFSLADLDDYVNAYDTIQSTTYDVNYNYQSILNHKPDLRLLSRDPILLEKYHSQVSLLEIQIKRYDFWLLYTKKAAEKLIKDIQTAYHFKND